MASPMRIERKPLPGDLKKEPTLESDLELDLSDVEAKEERATVPSKSMRVLGWEITAHRAPPPTSPQTSRPRTGRFAAFHEKFDQAVPPNQKYLGRSRRTFLIVVGLILFVLICLVIGLAVGLTIGRRGPKDLPLPTNAEQHTGDLTYYLTTDTPVLGACGQYINDQDNIVAVSHYVYDAAQTGSDPNTNPLCGQKLRATRYNSAVGGWRSVDLTVQDRCVGCQPNDIDTTTTVFDQLAEEALGRVNVTWAWLT